MILNPKARIIVFCLLAYITEVLMAETPTMGETLQNVRNL